MGHVIGPWNPGVMLAAVHVAGREVYEGAMNRIVPGWGSGCAWFIYVHPWYDDC